MFLKIWITSWFKDIFDYQITWIIATTPVPVSKSCKMVSHTDLELYVSIVWYLVVGVVITLLTAMACGYNIVLGGGYSGKDGNPNFLGFILKKRE